MQLLPQLGGVSPHLGALWLSLPSILMPEPGVLEGGATEDVAQD